MHILRYKRIYWVALAPVAWLISFLARGNPALTDRLYARGLYPLLAGGIGRVTALLPFSLVEFLLFGAVMGVLAWLAYTITVFVKNKDKRRAVAARFLATAACVGSLWYVLFVLLCGLNYSRLDFAAHSGLFVRPSAPQELAALCGELIDTVNDLRPRLPQDEQGVVRSTFADPYAQAAFAAGLYEKLGAEYPFLQGFTPRPKPVLASRLMSRVNIVGIFVPFTYECNINTDVTPYNLPSAMAHELAHFKGFMREDEANYIAWLACAASENEEFLYSGAMLALTHTANALASADREMYRTVMAQVSPGVWQDWQHNDAYWQQFEGTVSEVSTAVNDTYLRANRQSDGVKSYGRMVDLLLADYRRRHGLT